MWSDGFGFVPFFISAIFCIVIGTILFAIVKSGVEWTGNNHAPITAIQAKVAGKRTMVRGGSGNSSSSTSYYATFEQEETGERIELKVNGRTYGMIAEGDQGALTYQGTRYKSFERDA